MQSLYREENIFCMNTIITIRINKDSNEQVIKEVKEALIFLEKKLSRFLKNSDITKINLYAGKKFVEVDSLTLEILTLAKEMSLITEGLFDVTVAPLINIWDYRNQRVPSVDSINKGLKDINFQDILVKDNKVMLKHIGQAIDLGGIAKGFASDFCLRILRKYNVTSGFINIGGNVSILGNKLDNEPWNVGIYHPRQEKSILGYLKVTDKSVVTSGDYQRYFIDQEGIRRHHLLNPKTGCPADSGLISVSVISDNAFIADALSTAIFVGGMQKGLEYLSKFTDCEVIMVDEDLNVFITKGLVNNFHINQGININTI